MTPVRSVIDKSVTLADRFDLGKRRIFVNGPQALVRLTLMQRARDRAAGHNTAGYVSGYRGSPLGGVDQQFLRSGPELEAGHIVFQPALNEDLAATAMWGTQQAHLFGENKYDGVFGLWYGKGPGVDRCGDVFRHANLAGTAPLGGVLVLMGDDHTAESSTTAHQSEFAMLDAMMPILNPAGLQELLDYGLYGIELSRYSGCWVGLKAIKDTIEVTASIDADPHRINVVVPTDFSMPEGGLNIRPEDPVLAQEARLHDHKRFAATAFVKANGLDRIIMGGGRKPRIGIATLGKSYLDVRQALDELGIDEARAADLGLRLYKVAMAWPLEPDGVERFAEGLELIIVVEEKRSLVESQIREQMYGRGSAPVIVGKRDEEGRTLLPAKGALDPNQIAIAIAERVVARSGDEALAAHLAELKAVTERGRAKGTNIQRVPYFCAGCPHNTSTVVPEGMRALAGIGCHYMAKWMDRSTVGVTQMGGEGANWIGEGRFSKRNHVFANLGDGTYNHSGLLAVRAAIYSGVNLTYKILFNDAVAMTGGQANDGGLSVAAIANQIAAEGVGRIVVMSDEPGKYPSNTGFPKGTRIEHREELDRVQRELAQIPGVTALIYDQTCAAEKRRRRKRGLYPDPPKRVIINELVCEGCGDCGVKSNCVAIEPVETEFGRKRAIDQSSCNKDYSCVTGFCPSFVTVHGGRPRTGRVASAGVDSALAETIELTPPSIAAAHEPYSIVVTGVGGTGVVTIGALLAMAAHLEGKGCAALDMAGLAQKGGAVHSHIRISEDPDAIHAVRVEGGAADLVLGCDMVVTGGDKILAVMREGKTRVVVNTHQTMTADFTRKPDLKLPVEFLERAIRAHVGDDAAHFIDARALALGLIGDTIASNLFILGYASQQGLLPVSPEAIERAIELNGVAVAMNHDAFAWGRRAAVDLEAVAAVALPRQEAVPMHGISTSLDELVARREAFLTDYQNAAYARRYTNLVEAVKAVESQIKPGSETLTDAVARGYFKLLAYKDEYEVARLYTDGSFRRQMEAEFEGPVRLEFNLAPPILARRDPITGVPRKRAFGSWMMPVFGLIARLKWLRGTRLDPFGRTEERRLERRLIAEYEASIQSMIAGLGAQTIDLAAEIAALPLTMRGFGHVKQVNVEIAKAREAELVARFESASTKADISRAVA